MKTVKEQAKIKNNRYLYSNVAKLGSAVILTRGGGNAEIESIRIGVYYK